MDLYLAPRCVAARADDVVGIVKATATDIKDAAKKRNKDFMASADDGGQEAMDKM
jgi:hypothetical protein